MRLPVILAAGLGRLASGANAQVELKTYTNADGYLNVQALTCARLAGTLQENADLLTIQRAGEEALHQYRTRSGGRARNDRLL